MSFRHYWINHAPGRPAGTPETAGLPHLAAVAAACLALLIAVPARAQGADQLISLINAYRAAPGTCQGRQMHAVAPLAPHPALSRVQITTGTFLQEALKRAGYASEHAEAIHVSGLADARSVMAAIRQPYCRTLLSPKFEAVGAAHTGGNWTIVFAQPSPPLMLGAWHEAGKAILDAVNSARAKPRNCGDQAFAAASPLAWNGALGEAALAHSRDMAAQRYFNHQGKNGGQTGDRARKAGYHWQRIGENIALGQRSPQEVVADWLTSPGHCANIMQRSFTDMGAAYAVNGDSESGNVYWTQVFGTPR